MSGFILTSTIYFVNFASDKYVDIYNGNGCTKHLVIRFPIQSIPAESSYSGITHLFYCVHVTRTRKKIKLCS